MVGASGCDRGTDRGGPIHCSRCCPPPPLSREQIARSPSSRPLREGLGCGRPVRDPQRVRAFPGDPYQNIDAGGGGLVGLANSDAEGGHSDLWTFPDGRTWSIASHNVDPLGLQSTGEGQGSPNGDFAGDGTRLEVFGNPTFAGTVPNQIWISTDGIHWKRLSIDGTGGTAAMTQMSAFLMRDGILFSGLNGTWFGDATP
jgi:hypothetical protein